MGIKMKVGDMVRINCDNRFLNGKIGTIVLREEYREPVYGLCVLVEGSVYGFEESEVEVING